MIVLACAAGVCAGRSVHAPSALTSRCTYDACALNIVPRLRGLDVVRGDAEERVATLDFLWPRSVNAAFGGSAQAEHHASRALSIRRIASVMTDVGGLVAAAAAIRAAETPQHRRVSVGISLGGIALLGASVLPQFAADTELSRAVRDYNRQFVSKSPTTLPDIAR